MLIAVGSYNTFMDGPGLAVVKLTGDNMEVVAVDEQLKDPIWAEQSKKTGLLYVSATQENGRNACVGAYRFEDGALTLVSRQDDPGMGNCHLCLNEEETFLYSANYSDGTVAVFPLDQEGRILPCIQFFEHQAPLGPQKDRQERTHAHQVSFRPGTKELFLCDLGADQVVIYLAGEDGKLTLKEELICQPGSGPRHLSFDGENAFYLVGELDGWMSRWEYEAGKWQCSQTLSSLPEGYAGPANTAAAVRQDEGHVYLSNRGHDSIAVFKKLKNGWLEKPFFIRTPGTFPRDFLLMNGGFLLAQQNSGTVTYMNENGVPLAQVKIPGAVSLLVIDEK